MTWLRFPRTTDTLKPQRLTAKTDLNRKRNSIRSDYLSPEKHCSQVGADVRFTLSCDGVSRFFTFRLKKRCKADDMFWPVFYLQSWILTRSKIQMTRQFGSCQMTLMNSFTTKPWFTKDLTTASAEGSLKDLGKRPRVFCCCWWPSIFVWPNQGGLQVSPFKYWFKYPQ